MPKTVFGDMPMEDTRHTLDAVELFGELSHPELKALPSAAGGGAMGGIGSECGVGEIIGECGILKEWLGDKQPVP